MENTEMRCLLYSLDFFKRSLILASRAKGKNFYRLQLGPWNKREIKQ